MHLYFKNGSHFLKLFNEAIRENRHNIKRIHQKYWGGWLPYGQELPQKCDEPSSDPTPLSTFFNIKIFCLFF
jgi:hypothetical protein